MPPPTVVPLQLEVSYTDAEHHYRQPGNPQITIGAHVGVTETPVTLAPDFLTVKPSIGNRHLLVKLRWNRTVPGWRPDSASDVHQHPGHREKRGTPQKKSPEISPFSHSPSGTPSSPGCSSPMSSGICPATNPDRSPVRCPGICSISRPGRCSPSYSETYPDCSSRIGSDICPPSCSGIRPICNPLCCLGICSVHSTESSSLDCPPFCPKSNSRRFL